MGAFGSAESGDSGNFFGSAAVGGAFLRAACGIEFGPGPGGPDGPGGPVGGAFFEDRSPDTGLGRDPIGRGTGLGCGGAFLEDTSAFCATASARDSHFSTGAAGAARAALKDLDGVTEASALGATLAAAFALLSAARASAKAFALNFSSLSATHSE